MNYLVIGLGSMGKRRIRCLQALGETNVSGFDPRQDRRDEAAQKYSIPTFAEVEKALAEARPDALIISVPPDIHHLYVKLAVERGIHFFVEASVLDTDMAQAAQRLRGMDIVAAPSVTLLFHPAIRKVAEILKSGRLGKLSNLMHHTGQYLPDWHTYEKVSEYYVSNPATGGAREIVAFELGWITHVLGFPGRVCGNVRKTIHIDGAEKIDDTYNCLLDYGDHLACITIDVVSRHATRRLLINGERGQLVWDWTQNCIRIFDAAAAAWEEVPYEMASAAAGYNPNVGENMYIDELRSFIGAIGGGNAFPNTMENDGKVLQLLYAIEQSDRSGSFVGFKP